MAVVNVTQACNELPDMVDRVQDGERITITSKNRNAILMSEEEFLDRTGLPRARLAELLQLDWLHFVRTQQTLLFQEDDIDRVRKLERLCCDFELPVVGGTIVVELLDRISELEREVRHLRRLI